MNDPADIFRRIRFEPEHYVKVTENRQHYSFLEMADCNNVCQNLFLMKNLLQYGFRRKDFAPFGFIDCPRLLLLLKNVK
jgi:hypothetical protein